MSLSAKGVLGICVLVIVGSAGLAVLAGQSATARERDLRALRLESQALERRARQLGSPSAGPTLDALGETRDTLRVRWVEALDRFRRESNTPVLSHHVEERVRSPSTTAVTLRLTLEGQVAHGGALLELLDAVATAGVPWPVETRGCLVQRLPSALAVDCTVDLLHWEQLQVPVDE